LKSALKVAHGEAARAGDVAQHDRTRKVAADDFNGARDALDEG
jgi:hypothetical protein